MLPTDSPIIRFFFYFEFITTSLRFRILGNIGGQSIFLIFMVIFTVILFILNARLLFSTRASCHIQQAHFFFFYRFSDKHKNSVWFLITVHCCAVYYNTIQYSAVQLNGDLFSTAHQLFSFC